MNVGQIIVIGVALGVVLAIAAAIYHRLPKKLKTTKFSAQWKELQGQLSDKANWPKALADADQLLDSALRRRKFKGKTMGERMVSAQKVISNNDAMWFAHNLNKKLLSEPTTRLKEADVKAALIGFRNALKDIGALQPVQKPTPTETKEEETK